jgi:zinc/manganese transport system permease protein
MTELSVILPGLLAGFLVLMLLVPLGQEVLQRRMVFIDLALAQMAALGMLLPTVFGWNFGTGLTLLVGLAVAMAGGSLVGFLRTRVQGHVEAMIASVYVIAASLSFLAVAQSAHGTERLKQLLEGQLLWLTLPDLAALAAVVWLFSLLLWKKHDWVYGKGFFMVLAVAVVFSVQAVGVYLVFASLIMPVLWAALVGRTCRLWTLIGLGGLAYLLGMLLSLWVDLPTSGLVVLMMPLVLSLLWIPPFKRT